MSLGIYISVPFCRSKCSFCNFASGVFSRDRMQRYVDRVCGEIDRADEIARTVGGRIDREVDSIYLGGGTPSTLAPEQLKQLFDAVRKRFSVTADAEITVECAPGTLSAGMLDALLACGVNRVSLGAQSFIDKETASVGRLHTRAQTVDDISRLRAAGITNLSIDLIAGLPHQTRASWQESLDALVETGVPHASVYMLEVDEDSRLGRELIAGGTRYHAHHVPDDDLTADLYECAVEFLNSKGIAQYEISNFARAGCESCHNLKYWTRQPYLGFGLDAHSMLPASNADDDAVRFATTDDLDQYLAQPPATLASQTVIHASEADEERMFLALRLNRGVELTAEVRPRFCEQIESLIAEGLLESDKKIIRLTARGRLLSNDVFGRFIEAPAQAHLEEQSALR